VPIAGIIGDFTTLSSSTIINYQLGNSIKRLSTGMILPSDNPAGIGISERMRAQTSGVEMARRNITNQISMHQTSDSFGQTISNDLARMRDLAIQARGITNETDRSVLEDEFKMLQDDIASITSKDNAAGSFNDTKLFQGDNLTIQTGPDTEQTTDINLPDMQLTSTKAAGPRTFGDVINSAVGLSMMDADTLEALDGAIAVNTGSQAKNAAFQRAAQERYEGLLAYEDNLRESESKIRDVDYAKESTNLVKLLIQKQVNSALSAQGNNMASFGSFNLL